MRIGKCAQVLEILVRQYELNESHVCLITRFMTGPDYEITKSIEHHSFLTLKGAIWVTLLVKLSLFVSEVVEKPSS